MRINPYSVAYYLHASALACRAVFDFFIGAVKRVSKQPCILTKFILIIFIMTGERADIVGAELEMKAFQCIQEARKINIEGKNRWAACMPVAKD